MSDIAVRVNNLGKRYVIGGKQERYPTLRDTIVDVAAAPFRRVRGVLRGESAAGLKEEIWALKDVSFEVNHGEVVGIIGRNGAGKSTVLKILSRITEPTTGYADVYGRIGALLEVGTGFHLELTGRENIYLNGAILGMSREEIRGKFDEIVDFAGVEKFIDTPVKHYSSGMGLRLGFAVAAHLEPEILIVDEVLAVGDAEFQKKCLGKISEVAGEGRTAIFVSHNMSAIRQLCGRSIVLSQGGLEYNGLSGAAIEYYFSQFRVDQGGPTLFVGNTAHRSGVGGAKVMQIGCINKHGEQTSQVVSGEQFRIWFDVQAEGDLGRLTAGIEIQTQDSTPLTNINSASYGITFGPFIENETLRIVVDVPGLPLTPGDYFLEPWIKHANGRRIDHVHHPYIITLVSGGHFTSEKHAVPGRNLMLVDSIWSSM